MIIIIHCACSHTHMQCTRTGGLDALFEDTIFRSPDNKIALIGSGCSLATEPTAEVSHYYNISHVSFIVIFNIIYIIKFLLFNNNYYQLFSDRYRLIDLYKDILKDICDDIMA